MHSILVIFKDKKPEVCFPESTDIICELESYYCQITGKELSENKHFDYDVFEEEQEFSWKDRGEKFTAYLCPV